MLTATIHQLPSWQRSTSDTVETWVESHALCTFFFVFASAMGELRQCDTSATLGRRSSPCSLVVFDWLLMETQLPIRHHVMSCHVTSRHVMSCHVTSRHVMTPPTENWDRDNHGVRLDEHDRDSNLSNLRFADDIFLISSSLKHTTSMPDDPTTATTAHGLQTAHCERKHHLQHYIKNLKKKHGSSSRDEPRDPATRR